MIVNGRSDRGLGDSLLSTFEAGGEERSRDLAGARDLGEDVEKEKEKLFAGNIGIKL